ncbi:MAG: flavodoxin family protein [Spirochaetales bacterium]|nr:MAG: flavodoxin family protein [Spirochaetales bacterium]
MPRVLILYHSKTGNTKAMAEFVKKGVLQEGITDVLCKTVEETNPEELLHAEGIIIGSPAYYGGMAWQVKKFLDESIKYHKKLQGKVGGAFTSSGLTGGGNETTIQDILHALLIHGMVIQGTASGDHYGPVSIAAPDKTVEKNCENLGRRVAVLVDRLFGINSLT